MQGNASFSACVTWTLQCTTLTSCFLTCLPAAPTTLNAETAMNQIVEDATQCKFESTNNAQDEVVLLNIVQVVSPAAPSLV